MTTAGKFEQLDTIAKELMKMLVTCTKIKICYFSIGITSSFVGQDIDAIGKNYLEGDIVYRGCSFMLGSWHQVYVGHNEHGECALLVQVFDEKFEVLNQITYVHDTHIVGMGTRKDPGGSKVLSHGHLFLWLAEHIIACYQRRLLSQRPADSQTFINFKVDFVQQGKGGAG